MARHKIQQGESIGSIAKQSGLFWETIWNHPENVALKQKRDDPNILWAGDEVFIPETQLNHVEGGTQTRHRFRVKGVPAFLQIQFLLNEKPRANEPYELDIDGLLSSGQTDGQGWINEPIPPDAKKGKLTFDDEDQYELDLGHLDPIDETTGFQARLANLGLYYGEVDGEPGPVTEAALRRFQEKENLEVTGQRDAATRDTLMEAHGG